MLFWEATGIGQRPRKIDVSYWPMRQQEGEPHSVILLKLKILII